MKTRTDYVSNSSSSSFVLVGKIYSYDDLMSNIEKVFPKKINCHKLTKMKHTFALQNDWTENEGKNY